MIPASSIPDPLLELLDAIAYGDLDRPIPQCGHWLRIACSEGLALSLGGEPFATPAGLARLEHRP